jgi:hypothetical protein
MRHRSLGGWACKSRRYQAGLAAIERAALTFDHLTRLKFPKLALGYRSTEFVPTWGNFPGDHRTPYGNAFVE